MNTTANTSIDRAWLPLSIVVLSFVGLYYHVFGKLVYDWLNNDNYSHGFLIPFIAGYLIWQRRKRLSRLMLKPSNYGLIILLVGLCIFLIAYIGAELFTMRFSMLIVIWGLIVFLLGYQFGKATLVPVAYLAFMIPLPAIIWNKVAFPLKLFATKMAVGVISWLDIPVYREGNIIHLSNTTLQVVDACSGMRSLGSLLALGAAFVFITHHSKTKKWILFLSAVPIAVLLNIVRLSATAALAQRYGAQITKGFLHESSGILVFFFAIFCLYLVHLLFKKFSS